MITACTPYQATLTEERQTGPLIKIKDYRFLPQQYRTSVGTTITWRNDDRDSHSVEVDGETSWKLATGEVFTHNFTKAGVYSYNSGNHPFMKATIIVD